MKKRGFTDEMLVEATGFSETDDEEILEARATFKQLYEQFKPEIDKEHEQVVEAGGLFIIGTERHESRRIDNQLRGRSGRQGDPGESRFYISLEDDLMRLFGSERLERMVDGLGLADDEPITHQMLTGAIENAQKRVEGRNFQIRKHVLQYDDVMNVQRNTIYSERQRVLNGENLRDSIYKMIDEFVDATIASYTGSADYPDDWNLAGLTDYVESIYMPKGALTFTREEFERLTRDKLREILLETAHARYEEKEAEFGAEAFREIERIILLQVVDRKWMDHIDNMDQLRQGIGLRAYAQRDPVIEYKEEGYNMYEEMLGAIGEDVIKFLFNVRAERKMEREAVAQPTATSHGDGTLEKKPVTKGNKVGRNDPCPCGSGKKYKKCCGMYADGQTPTE